MPKIKQTNLYNVCMKDKLNTWSFKLKEILCKIELE